MAVFNDTTNKKGLIQACERYTNLGDAGISSNSLKLLDFTNWINDGGRFLWEVIMKSSHNWIYDDSNQVDLPQAATNLVSGTGKYSIPTGALTVKRVEIMDAANNWRLIEPYTIETLNEAIDEFYKVAGQPQTYRLVGTTIELKPAPNYSVNGGLKIYFDREGISFLSTDTTATPGFASIFHDLEAVYASMQWLKIKDPTNSTLTLLREDWAGAVGKGGRIESFYMKNLPAKINKVGRMRRSYK